MTILFALFTLLSTSLAATRPHPGPTTHLYVCIDANFTGSCSNVPLEVSACCTSASLSPTPLHSTNVMAQLI
jgi:hypothetical protein